MIHALRRVEEAAGMALSDDLRKRVVDAVVVGGLSRNAAAKRFGVSIASAIRWVWRFQATGEISPAPTGGDRRSDRIEAHREYLLGLIRRQPDITLLEIQEERARSLRRNLQTRRMRELLHGLRIRYGLIGNCSRPAPRLGA